MSRARVLVIGEALVDIVHRSGGRVDEAPGGSPANVALALGRLGDSPRLLTQLGDDAHGRRIREWLDGSDVEIIAAPAPRTATATAHLDENGSARYDFDITWTLGGRAAEVPADDTSIVHTGSIAALLAPGADAVRSILTALRATALITYDPNVRPALLSDQDGARRDVESFVALADLVKASDEDLTWLYPGADPLDVARAWLETGPAVVVVTTGAGGAFAVSRDGVSRVRGHRVDVVDTVGAGDTFMSALIHGLIETGFSGVTTRDRLRGIDTDAVTGLLALGARAAAITVSRPGADPPRLAELLAAPLSH